MKSIKVILAIAIALMPLFTMAQGQNWWTSEETKSYKGNEYHILYCEYFFSITNKKYEFPSDTYTGVVPFKGETTDSLLLRMHAQVLNGIEKIVYSVIPKEQLQDGSIQAFYYFDSQNSDYVGASFTITNSLRDIVTVEKIYQIERKLLAAHTNAGKFDFRKPNKKYFILP